MPVGGIGSEENKNSLKEPLHATGSAINSNNINYNQLGGKHVLDSESNYSSQSSVGYVQRNLKTAVVKSEEVRRLMMMFFSFCDPLNSKV